MAGKDPRRRVRCLLCDKTPTLNNFTTHLTNMHPNRYQAASGIDRRQLYDELAEQPGASVELAAVVARAGSLPAPMAELPPLHAEDLDEIVLAVVQQLAGSAGADPGQLPAGDLHLARRDVDVPAGGES